MILAGLLLIIISVIAGVLLFMGTSSLTDHVDVNILNGTIGLPPLALLITGAAVITVFWLGWALLRGGIKLNSRRRKEAKAAARDAEARRVESDRKLAEERRLREQQEADLKRQSDERYQEQHLATETARQRAEVAERQLRDRADGPTA